MPTLPTFPHVLAQLHPIVSPVYSAIEGSLQKTREFFENDHVEVDRSLAPNLVRYYAKRFLTAEGLATEYEQADAADYELRQLPNNGLCLKYDRHEIRILKADDGELPAPGPSMSRQKFWNWNGQLSFNFSYGDALPEASEEKSLSLHLIVLWDVDPFKYNLKRLLLGCPISGDETTASAYFLEEIPHPIEAIDLALTSNEGLVADDLDLNLKVKERADGQR